MPHYKDGTPAEIGDFVKGVSYNHGGKEIVGTLVQITEGTDSCNCIVAFVDPVVTDLPLYEIQRDGSISLPPTLTRRAGGRIPAGGGGDQRNEHLFLKAKFDYGALKDFVKV